MGLLRKFFGKDADAAPGTAAASESTQFHDSDANTGQEASRNAPRRELVQVVLRDAMRRHGIPSDWIECRIFTVAGSRRSGLHVQFVVKGGTERLLTYVQAFQDSFRAEITKFEPRAADWLLSIGWQFDDPAPGGRTGMPDPASWSGGGAGGAGSPPADDDIEQDLAALFAIRDAALQAAPQAPDFEPTRPGFQNSADDRK